MGSQNTRGINLLYMFPLIILFQTFSLFYGWVPRVRTDATLYFGVLVGAVVCMKYYTKPMMVVFVLYVVVLYINHLLGDYWLQDRTVVRHEVLYLLLPAMMGYAITSSNNSKLVKITIVSFLLMIVVNAIGTSYIDSVLPGSIRKADELQKQGESITAYYRLGLSNYALPSGLVTIIPMLILGIKMNTGNRKKKNILIIGLVASLMLVYYSSSMAALIFGIFGVLFTLFIKPGTNNRQLLFSFVLISIIITILLSNDGLMLSLLKLFDKWVGDESYFHKKIVDMEYSIVSGETTGSSVRGRESLYLITWNGIMRNPLLGVNEPLGGHSILLDHWGYLGLVGLIPFLCFVIGQIKLLAKFIPKESRLVYFICIIITFMMMMIKHMNTWESWLCLFTILPVLAVYCSGKKEEKNEILKY